MGAEYAMGTFTCFDWNRIIFRHTCACRLYVLFVFPLCVSEYLLFITVKQDKTIGICKSSERVNTEALPLDLLPFDLLQERGAVHRDKNASPFSYASSF